MKMSQSSCRFIVTSFVSVILAFMVIGKPLLAQDQSMFEGFWTFCVEQAIEETHVPRTNLYEFSEDEIEQLGSALGWGSIPDAVWAPNDGSWLILDQHDQYPGFWLCTATSVHDPLDHNVSEWNEKLESDGSFRSRRKASVGADRSGGWATKAVDNGFVQISLNNLLTGADRSTNLSILLVVRVEQSPASCEMFPSKCN